MPLLNIANAAYLGTQNVSGIYKGDIRVWPPAEGSQPQVTNISSGGTLTVSWAASDFADSYELRRNGTLISTQSTLIYNDSGLKWGTTHSYTVTPVINDIPGTESSASPTITIPAGTVGSISASNRSTNYLTISWAAVPGATGYSIYKSGATAGQAATSRALDIDEDTTYSIKVRAYQDSENPRVYGNYSNTYTYYSGRKEQRDTGSKTDMVFSPSKVDSYRTFDGWSALTNLAGQGIYTPGRGYYRGVIYYGNYGVRGPLRNKLANNEDKAKDRQQKGKCTSAELYLYKRPNVGVYGPVNVGIQRSNSTADGGAPNGTDMVTISSTNNGSGKWYNIGKGHGNALGDGDNKSLLIKKDTYADYAHFSDCRLRLSWSWDYVTVSAKANTWTV